MAADSLLQERVTSDWCVKGRTNPLLLENMFSLAGLILAPLRCLLLPA